MRSTGPILRAQTGAHETIGGIGPKNPARTLTLINLTQKATMEAMNRNPDTTHMNNEDTESDSSSESDDEEEFELPELTPRTFAASSATEAEEKLAKAGRHPDGSAQVKVPKRLWRPKLRIEYEEPEALLDTPGDMDWLFEDHGKVLIEDKRALPERDDIIICDPVKHAK
jgi:hypothetical protein